MLKGSIVAIVTPMTETGEVDKKAFANLLEMHMSNNTDGIVVNGTTGESATLSNDESIDLIKFSLDVVNKKIPIIAGTGTNSTHTTIEKTKLIQDLGVTAALVVAPYYNRPTQEGLYLHYKKLSESVTVPIILYNVPTRTASDILPETVVKLAEISNIIGIKEATGSLERLKYLKNSCPEDFLLYSGDDATCMEFMLQGGDGVISVTANVMPKLMKEMCDFAIGAENISMAREINAKLADLHSALMMEPNPIPVKWVLSNMGLINSGIRLPLTTLTKNSQNKLREILSLVADI